MPLLGRDNKVASPKKNTYFTKLFFFQRISSIRIACHVSHATVEMILVKQKDAMIDSSRKK